jgi:hypothetical protein
MTLHGRPFPFDAVRDALGLVRLAYAARPSDQRERLEAVGRELRLALKLASAGEGTLGHRAAIDRVKCAARGLDDLFGDDSGKTLARVAKTRILEPAETQKAG